MIEDPEKLLLYLFDHIGKLIRDKVSDRLSEHNLHIGQARALVALHRHKSLTQKELGSGLDIKPATVTNFVKRMEASGLIERSHDAADDRVKHVCLTKKGREAASFTLDVFLDVEEELRENFSKQEVLDFDSKLLVVRDVLGGRSPEV